jgi:hypothetical protein
MSDDRLLLATELRVAKDALKQIESGFHGGMLAKRPDPGVEGNSQWMRKKFLIGCALPKSHCRRFMPHRHGRSALALMAILITHLFMSAAASAQPAASTQDLLRLLATQMKSAEAEIAAGQDVASLQRLEVQVRGLGPDATRDPEDARKHRAVMLELARLKQLSANSHGRPSVPSRATFDTEVVTSSHGAECGNALGLSASLPVSITMAARSMGGSSAWLRVLPEASETLRVSASSTSADPRIQVFSSCDATQTLVASDDTIGLGASLSLSALARRPFFIHVLNSGASGNVLVGVQDGNGSVTGTVRDAVTGNVISNAYVDLFAVNGAILATTSSGPDGTYTIAQPAGDYYLISQAPSYVTQIFSGIDCPPGFQNIAGCDPSNASVVTVVVGATVPGIDFSLDHGHSIWGQIRDSDNHPLGGSVVLYNAAGTALQSYGSDEFGHYQISALPPATYKIAAESIGYDAQMYDGIRCAGVGVNQCSLAEAAAIVMSGMDIFGIDFAMPTSAAISGKILLPNGQPAAAQVVAVPISPTSQGASAFADQGGNYRLGPLQTGSYHVYVEPGTGYFPEAYPGIDCSTYDCRYELTGAAQIGIAQPGTQVTINLQLDPIPPVTGHVSDATTGAPLAGVEIHTNSTFGFYFFPTSVVTDSNGNFSTNAFSVGQYYFWARSTDHVDQLYSGVDCETDGYFVGFPFPCSLASATTVNVAPGPAPSPLTFQLRRSSAISGTVLLEAGPSSHIPWQMEVEIYDSAGKFQKSAQSDALGNYIVNDIPPGTYFALADSNGPVADQLWPGVNCLRPCTLSMGQPIQVASGATASAIDFRITRQDAVVGRVTDASGVPVTGALVDLFLQSDSSYLGSAEADADGYYIAQWALGAYFVATEAGHGYIDQVHEGIACPLGAAYYGLCSFANATAVNLNSSNLQPNIVNFVLQRADPIFSNGFE